MWNKVLKPRGVSSAESEGQNIILQQEHRRVYFLNVI